MEQKDYRLAAIMYTDIAGFSKMMEKDESGTLETLSWHNKLITTIVLKHHGTVIKTIGDAFLVDFKNTVEAVVSAVEIQDELYKRNSSNPGSPLLVRIGVHLGDIYFFENDALGEGINIAARLQGLAKPGSICISQDVYNLVLNKIDFSAQSLGSVTLKNISKEIRAYEIASLNTGLAPAGEDKPRNAPGSPPDREYSETGSLDILAKIRNAILSEIKTSGKRMSVREAREKYGYYGVEAAEVIASLAERGILRKDMPPQNEGSRLGPQGSGRPYAGQADPSGDHGSESDNPDNRPTYTQSDIGRSIENAVHGIVSEIERSIESSVHGKGGLAADHSSRHASRETRREFKEEIKRRAREAIDEGRYRPGRRRDSQSRLRDEANDSPGPTHFELYRDKLLEKAKKVSNGLRAHFATFLMVNAGLWYLNLTTSRSFLWAAIVTASWGIGLVGNIVDSIRLNSEAREAEVMPDLDARTLEDLKRLNKERNSMSGHTVSAITVPMLLAVINLLTSPSTPWFLIPTGALAFSLVIHLLTYVSSVPALKKSIFKAIKISGGTRGLKRAKEDRQNLDQALGSYAEMYRDAERARQALEEQLADMKATAGEDIRPSLERYMGQVRLLAQSANEIDRLIEAIPMEELQKDKATLASKALASESSTLKAEYQSSIAEIEKQEYSFRELKDQSEVIRLRLGSSVNQLKQMRLDMARLKASGAEEVDAGFSQIRTKADELSHYLDDLRAGYEENAKDPFEELARLEARGRLPGQKKAAERIVAPLKAIPAAPEAPAQPEFSRNVPGVSPLESLPQDFHPDH